MRRLLRACRRHLVGLTAVGALAVIGLGTAAVPSASGAFSAAVTNPSSSIGTATYFHCSDALAQDRSSALFQWPLADAAGSTTAADISGANRTGTYVGTMATSSSTPVACPRDGGTAWDLDGTSSAGYYSVQQSNPQVFTIEIWFRTTVAGGKLIGFGRNATGANGTYDRHLFLSSTGAVVFGVYNGSARTVTSARGYNDGAWHYAAATLSSAGMVLYVDGKQVAANANSAAESGTGYWRVGYDSISTSWTSPAVSPYFKGQLRYAAVYTTALTAQQIGTHWGAGSGT